LYQMQQNGISQREQSILLHKIHSHSHSPSFSAMHIYSPAIKGGCRRMLSSATPVAFIL
jgi:hypothetical protein